MEQQMAILMADLSGYTALTETHGPASAADLIDKYLQIVNNCLCGSSILHERTGDAVMVVASSADDLMKTTTGIIEHTAMEENFLQLHGGMHYGPVLKRGNSYFGAAINMAARLAAKAGPGSFWCSADFVQQVSDPAQHALQPKGMHLFKNVSAAVEVWALERGHTDTFIDPVCKMMILDHRKAVRHPELDQLFFCSDHCLAVYLQTMVQMPVATASSR